MVVVFCNFHIISTTADKIYSSSGDLPRNNTGLVLGTSQYLRGGGVNPYFSNRIDAAVELFELGRIRNIIVSGDNSLVSYNEPVRMQEALLERGIPAERIFLDYAGFRTLDSVIRAKKIFGQEYLTIITQRFHAQRALYIAEHHGITAVAYTAGGVGGILGSRVLFRELFAKVKAVLDIHLFHTQPRFLGDPVNIP
jgi:SanA protein